MKTLLIYHNEDNDGLFSAAIIYNYLTNKAGVNRYDIQLMGATYNTLAEFNKKTSVSDLHENYDTVIMTDISFTASYMKNLYDEFGNQFIWLDHHAPIIKASYDNDFNGMGIRNTSKSAILCAFEYYYDPFNVKYNEKEIPEIFRILSGWDSWSYEREGYTNEYVKRINKAITIKYELDFQTIYSLVHDIIEDWEATGSQDTDDSIVNIQELNSYGGILINYEDIVMRDIIKTVGDKSWNIVLHDEDRGRPLYLKACALFHQGASNSLMFKSLQNTDIKIGLVFKHAADGNWTMSMYNVNDDNWFHCGEFLSEHYGGGGHKGAAGCTFTQDQFIEILKKKSL